MLLHAQTTMVVFSRPMEKNTRHGQDDPFLGGSCRRGGWVSLLWIDSDWPLLDFRQKEGTHQ